MLFIARALLNVYITFKLLEQNISDVPNTIISIIGYRDIFSPKCIDQPINQSKITIAVALDCFTVNTDITYRYRMHFYCPSNIECCHHDRNSHVGYEICYAKDITAMMQVRFEKTKH